MADKRPPNEELFDPDKFDPDRFVDEIMPAQRSPEEEIAALREPLPEELRDDQEPEEGLSLVKLPPGSVSLAEVAPERSDVEAAPENQDDPTLSRAELAFFRESLTADVAELDRAAGPAGDEPFQFD